MQIEPLMANAEENDFNFKEILYKYLAYWKWFLASFIISLIVAFIYLQYQTPIYKIQCSLLIKDEKKGLGQDAMLKELNIFSSNKVVDNEIEILKSYTLMEKVVKGLNLNTTYYYKDNFKNLELYNSSPVKVEIDTASDLLYEEPVKIRILNSGNIQFNDLTLPAGRKVNTKYGTLNIKITGQSNIDAIEADFQPVEKVVEYYMENLNVEASSKMSTVLILNINIANQQKGKDILNRLIAEYNNAGLEDKNKVAAITLRFIEDRLKLLSGDLATVEKNVEEFKAREKITDISSESEIFLKNVQENDKQLNEVKIQQGILNNIQQYIRNKENSAGTFPATLGITDPVLLNLIQSLSELEAKRAQTIKLVKADNPLVISLDEQIRTLKSSLNENISTLQKSLNITRQQLEDQNQQMESIIRTVPGKERMLIDITRQQTIKNNLYIFLLQKREETALSYASTVSDSRTIDLARSSIKPVKPVKKNIYILFSLIGLAVPFGLIYLADLLNDKVKSRKDIEKFTKTPILGDIHFAEHNEPLVVSKLGRTVLAEQIRALRTNLSFLSPGQNLQTILFTSSMSGEGKSFISLNLGASLALTGKKTVILELDMRKPKLHASLGISPDKGLSGYFIGKNKLNEIIIPVTGQDNYFIIPCGPIPPNPAELLIHENFRNLFKELRAQFDYIILDAPPVGLVTDAQIMADQADATLYVIRHAYTPKDRLELIEQLYEEKKFKNLNLIFNGIKEGAKYGYGPKYGYGYYMEEKKKEGNFFRKYIS